MPVAAEGLQRRSKLENTMQEWFAEQGQRLKFVLWGPGGTGKTTLALKFAAGQAKDAAPRSPVRLVFALSRGSMVEGYAGLLGESCMYVGANGEDGLARATDTLGRQTAGEERGICHGTRGGASEGARGAAVADVERAMAGGAG